MSYNVVVPKKDNYLLVSLVISKINCSGYCNNWSIIIKITTEYTQN